MPLAVAVALCVEPMLAALLRLFHMATYELPLPNCLFQIASSKLPLPNSPSRSTCSHPPRVTRGGVIGPVPSGVGRARGAARGHARRGAALPRRPCRGRDGESLLVPLPLQPPEYGGSAPVLRAANSPLFSRARQQRPRPPSAGAGAGTLTAAQRRGRLATRRAPRARRCATRWTTSTRTSARSASRAGSHRAVGRPARVCDARRRGAGGGVGEAGGVTRGLRRRSAARESGGGAAGHKVATVYCDGTAGPRPRIRPPPARPSPPQPPPALPVGAHMATSSSADCGIMPSFMATGAS